MKSIQYWPDQEASKQIEEYLLKIVTVHTEASNIVRVLELSKVTFFDLISLLVKKFLLICFFG